ncbi:MAG: rhodanese-like domain-containing protein, partial [Pseudomonadota bacterium]
MRPPRQTSETVITVGRLWPAWCIPLGLLFAALTLFDGGALASEKIISAPTAQKRLSAGELILIDIRSPKEWSETGVPMGARAITMHNPKGKRAFLEAIKTAVNGNQSQEIALICAVGGRSRWAQGFLTKHGFTNVTDVSEGMLGR